MNKEVLSKVIIGNNKCACPICGGRLRLVRTYSIEKMYPINDYGIVINDIEFAGKSIKENPTLLCIDCSTKWSLKETDIESYLYKKEKFVIKDIIECQKEISK